MLKRKVIMTFDLIINILSHIILFIYLTICTITDIRTNTISRIYSICCGLVLLLLSILSTNISFTDILISAFPGLCLLLLGIATRQAIGYGDGIATMIIGICVGLNRCFIICLIAFLIAAIVSCIKLMERHPIKSTLPFIPFLLLAFILNNIFNLMEVI